MLLLIGVFMKDIKHQTLIIRYFTFSAFSAVKHHSAIAQRFCLSNTATSFILSSHYYQEEASVYHVNKTKHA